MVSIGSGAEQSGKDYMLTRYACYLIADRMYDHVVERDANGHDKQTRMTGEKKKTDFEILKFMFVGETWNSQS